MAQKMIKDLESKFDVQFKNIVKEEAAAAEHEQIESNEENSETTQVS